MMYEYMIEIKQIEEDPIQPTRYRIIKKTATVEAIPRVAQVESPDTTKSCRHESEKRGENLIENRGERSR